MNQVSLLQVTYDFYNDIEAIQFPFKILVSDCGNNIIILRIAGKSHKNLLIFLMVV